MELNKSKIAKRYASSFIDVAESKQYKTLLAQMESVREILKLNPDLIKFSHNPLIDIDERIKLIEDTLKPLGIEAILIGLIDILARNGRLGLFDTIMFFFAKMVQDRVNESVAQVYSVKELDEPAKKRIAECLEQFFKKKIILDCKLDSSLMGGLRVQVGNKIIDYSIQGELQRINSVLKEEG
ncbi:MAG: ATP synthase F1 subunit delta [Candidatus Auribacterota bacterium]|jgi:ATP synthase F1 delta subunit|nr:ATP synthase F1 subunit delta [Candidatus Auribacterota bacterium]